MATVPAEVQGPSDAELIDAVRKGDVSAYGDLYERHSAAAYNLARQLARSQAERDDLVSEAFEKVLATLRAGRGPDSAFRAYLLTALRHTAYDKTRRERKLELAEDVSEVSGVSPEAVSVPFTDPAVAGLERSMAARAYARLPERWQAVLWHTAIEGQSPAEVAPILGLTPNAVSALAYRAREALKEAYLQVHLAETNATESRCQATNDRLGAWTRGGLSKREKAQVEAHLDECARCRALAAELADVNSALRIFVAPLVLGGGTLGYLASAAAMTKAAVAGGVAVAGAAGAAAGAGAGSAGAGAAAGASAPRQVLGVAASAAVLAAAVAVGLAAGGAQEIPRAAQAAPAPTTNPPAPPAPPGTPAPPATQAPPNAPPPQQPPAQQQPAPAPANLIASASSGGTVSLEAGGGPADLPITVRNTGGSVSGPVSATLNLPPGVTALATGPSRFAGTPLLRLNGARQSSTVFCPGGTGRVTCGTDRGLQPNEAVTLLFRVVAAEGSQGGEITGSVSDGSSINVKVTVKVVVKPPPPPPVLADGVSVKAHGSWIDTLLPGLLAKPLLQVTATNTGQSTEPITLSVDRAGVRLSSSTAMACTSAAGSTTCTTKAPVKPGASVKLSIKMKTWLGLLHRCDDPTVVITAILGDAKASQTIKLDCWTLPGLPDLVPNGGVTPPKPPEPATPPRPPVKPQLQAPVTPSLPALPKLEPPATTPAPPPSPLPKVEPPPPPTTPPPSSGTGGILGPLLGWLLPTR